MVDAHDSKSCTERCGGSIPPLGTRIKLSNLGKLGLCYNFREIFMLPQNMQALLVRVLFLIFALGSAYGVYDNREFLVEFPFYIVAAADTVFALVFFYLFFVFDKLKQRESAALFLSTLLYGGYVLIVNLTSFWLYTSNLGIQNAASQAGLSTSSYIVQQVVHLGVAPTIVFVIVIWLIRRIG